MSDHYASKKFKELLDRLQEDSWQLELLVSGFTIFGLFSAVELVEIKIVEAQILGQVLKPFALIMVYTSCYILIFNLVIHLILRGLWIGALGLRYISGDIDFEVLNYTDRFKNYLKKKIVSYDKYVATLENYCSVLFAISFLMIFYLIAFLMIVAIIGGIGEFIAIFETPRLLRRIVMYITITFFSVGGLLTMIDFFTQGFLKKKKILSKIYFPFYKIFSYVTLSFLYRPLVYNFLDNKFGKRISMFLVPIYILIFFLSSIMYVPSNYLNEMEIDGSILLKNNHYENMQVKETDFVQSTSIQSKIIKDNYLKIFCVFDNKIEDTIFKYYPKLKPEDDLRGYTTEISFSDDDELTIKRRDSLAKEYLKAYNKIHQVFVDSIQYNSDFIVGKNIKGQLGFETYIGIKDLSDGKHIFRLKRMQKDKKEIKKTNHFRWISV